MIVAPAQRLLGVEEYYFSGKLRQIRQMNEKGEAVLNLGIGSPDMDPAEEVVAMLREEVVRRGSHAYQSYRGLLELRRAFAKWYRDYFGVALRAEDELLPLMGSKEGLMHLAMAFLEEGDEALVPDPAYPTYAAVTRLSGASPVFYELKEERGWLPDLASLEERDLSRVKIMWLNYPNMPTGALADRAFFSELVSFAARHRILLVNDNPYAFIFDRRLSLLSISGARELAVELNSLSKSHNMAGWRIGVLAGDSAYLQAVLRFKSNMDSGMFRPLQLAAVRALSLGEAWYQRLHSIYMRRRKRAFALLDVLGCSYDVGQGGLFVWAKIPDGFSCAYDFSDVLLSELRVFITPGGVFGSVGDRYLRLSLCNDESVFEEAIARLRAVGGNTLLNGS